MDVILIILKMKIKIQFSAINIISVLSNISHEETVSLKSIYLKNGLSCNYLLNRNDLLVISDFMMVVNNYYTPKIYDLTNSVIDNIGIQFRNVYEALIPIRSSYSSGDPTITNR
jgi:hypothetical protein